MRRAAHRRLSAAKWRRNKHRLRPSALRTAQPAQVHAAADAETPACRGAQRSNRALHAGASRRSATSARPSCRRRRDRLHRAARRQARAALAPPRRATRCSSGSSSSHGSTRRRRKPGCAASDGNSGLRCKQRGVARDTPGVCLAAARGSRKEGGGRALMTSCESHHTRRPAPYSTVLVAAQPPVSRRIAARDAHRLSARTRARAARAAAGSAGSHSRCAALARRLRAVAALLHPQQHCPRRRGR
jgi:hypothetical protein